MKPYKNDREVLKLKNPITVWTSSAKLKNEAFSKYKQQKRCGFGFEKSAKIGNDNYGLHQEQI